MLVIRGRATDFAGGALAGVSVGIASLGLGANTTADGRFRLEIPAESTIRRSKMTIVARRIGFATAKLDLDVGVMDSLTATIRLCSTIMELQDAHVVSGVAAYESITNTQHAGVDEGGIVKLRGEHLLILRRGRLFTVSIADRDTRPMSTVDAFGPGLDPSGAWYDELILAGNKVVVVGFSYARGGTELGVFEIDDAGRLRYLSTYPLRSNDYYSSRNYASRLIGSKLVFYTPLTLSSDPTTVSENLPSMRKWREGGEREAFQPIVRKREATACGEEKSPRETRRSCVSRGRRSEAAGGWPQVRAIAHSRS
ncbi:MAG: beta-propeller domain-containing protein [Gemmatimonadaceae bacterium]